MLMEAQKVALWFEKMIHTVLFALLSSTKGEDFSNELPSSSSSSSLPSSLPSSDLPHSSFLPHPESPLNVGTSGSLHLEVAAPHYHENQLQVKVFWKVPNRGELISILNKSAKKKNKKTLFYCKTY